MGVHADRVPAQPAQVGCGLLARIGLATGDDDARACEHEPLRQGQPDSAGAARHDHGAVGHVEQGIERRAVHVGQ